MANRRSVLVGVASLLVALFIAAGCNTPSSICNDQRNAYNAAYARCGIPAIVPTNWLTWSGGPCSGMPATCDNVTKITDPGQILNECIPALEAIDCDTLAVDLEGPSECNVSVYQAVAVEGDSCGG